jgi:hypothetical protein
VSNKLLSATWALDLAPPEKLVLLALADAANGNGLCWPGLVTIAKQTGKSRSRVVIALRRLERAGHISRETVPGIKTNYSVHPQRKPDDQLELPMEPNPSSMIERVPKRDRFPNGTDGSSKRDGTRPPDGTRTLKNPKQPKKEEAGASSKKTRPAFAPPPGVSGDQWRDFLSVRANRKAKMTETAYSRLCAKLERLREDGWPPGEMIGLAVERGWTSVFPPREQVNGTGQDSGIGRTEAAARAVLASLDR